MRSVGLRWGRLRFVGFDSDWGLDMGWFPAVIELADEWDKVEKRKAVGYYTTKLTLWFLIATVTIFWSHDI